MPDAAVTTAKATPRPMTRWWWRTRRSGVVGARLVGGGGRAHDVANLSKGRGPARNGASAPVARARPDTRSDSLHQRAKHRGNRACLRSPPHGRRRSCGGRLRRGPARAPRPCGGGPGCCWSTWATTHRWLGRLPGGLGPCARGRPTTCGRRMDALAGPGRGPPPPAAPLDDDGVLRSGRTGLPAAGGGPAHRGPARALRRGGEPATPSPGPAGRTGSPGRNALDVHVLRLRRRLAPVGLVIRTVRSRGYLLEQADPRSSDQREA